MAKNPPAMQINTGSIPGLGRSLGGGNGNPLQYSCLGNPVDRGAWWATVHKVSRESDMTERLNNNNTIYSIKTRVSFELINYVLQVLSLVKLVLESHRVHNRTVMNFVVNRNCFIFRLLFITLIIR